MIAIEERTIGVAPRTFDTRYKSSTVDVEDIACPHSLYLVPISAKANANNGNWNRKGYLFCETEQNFVWAYGFSPGGRQQWLHMNSIVCVWWFIYDSES